MESKEYYCSESVFSTINELLGSPYDPSTVKLAAGFGVGIGQAGGPCGALSGGVMALGIAYDKEAPEGEENVTELSASLHDFIEKKHGTSGCIELSGGTEIDSCLSICAEITGDVAAWIAEKLIEDGKIKAKD